MSAVMPFFCAPPDRRFDPKVLMPAKLSKGERFETLNDVKDIWVARRKVLVGSKDSLIGEAIDDIDACLAGREPCERVICPGCERLYRRWLASCIIQQAEQGHFAAMLTNYLSLLPAGDLDQFNVNAFHSKIRQRMRRAGLQGTIIIGGTEFAWRHDRGCWLAHMHVVAIDAAPDAIERFRAACRSDGIPGLPALRVNNIHDLPKVATYVQKFGFWHHPGGRTGPHRPRAVPLPRPQARELACYLLGLRFQDLLFLFSCRRAGRQIVAIAQEME